MENERYIINKYNPMTYVVVIVLFFASIVICLFTNDTIIDYFKIVREAFIDKVGVTKPKKLFIWTWTVVKVKS